MRISILPSPRTYTDHLAKSLAQSTRRVGAQHQLSLLFISWVFPGGWLPVTQIRTLAPAAEASRSGSMLCFTSHRCGARPCTTSASPEHLGSWNLIVTLRVSQGVWLSTASSSKGCWVTEQLLPLPRAFEVQAPVSRVIGQDLERSLQSGGLRFSSVLSSHSLGDKVGCTELRQLLSQLGMPTSASLGSQLPVYPPRFHGSIILFLKSSLTLPLSFPMGLQPSPSILFYILSSISTLKMTAVPRTPGSQRAWTGVPHIPVPKAGSSTGQVLKRCWMI